MFKLKKNKPVKTGIHTPKFRNPTPPPPLKPPKQKENKTMYGLKLYIPFEDLDAYIHNHIEDAYKDHTFIPVKVEVNEVTLDVEISLVSAVPVECDKRYKIDLNVLSKDNKPKRGLRANTSVYDDAMDPVLKDIVLGKGLSRLDTNLDPNKPLPSGIRKEFTND